MLAPMKKTYFASGITLLFVALCLGCAGPAKNLEQEESSGTRRNGELFPFPIIDAHIHTDFDGAPEKTSQIVHSKEQLIKEFKAANIVGGISHESRHGEKLSDLSKQGVIHCAAITDKVNIKKLELGIKQKKYRCIKFYLGYVHRYAYDKKYEPIYQIAQKYDVPVVFHTGDTYSEKAKLKYAHPLTIDEVAVDHPKVKFVIAHLGNPWIRTAAEVAYKNPNVYLDGSALLIGDISKLDDADLKKYIVEPVSYIFGYIEDPTKILFGTDWPLVDIRAYAEVFKKAIPRKYWVDVFHDNAIRVFKIPGLSLKGDSKL